MSMWKAMTLALTILSAAACGGGEDSGAAVAKTDDALGLPADFDAFYERFHADSAYQMAHVTWPLDGNIVTNAAGASRDEQWVPDDWRLHRPVDLGDSYVREVSNDEDELVTERIRTREGKYILERRFAKLGGDWYLIWYRVAELG